MFYAFIISALIKKEVKGVVWGEVGNLVLLVSHSGRPIDDIRKGYVIGLNNNFDKKKEENYEEDHSFFGHCFALCIDGVCSRDHQKGFGRPEGNLVRRNIAGWGSRMRRND